MMRGLVIILLIVVLSASTPYLGDAESKSKCDGAGCYCGPCQPIVHNYITQNGECVKICTCYCGSSPPPVQTNPLEAPPPATKSNPQPHQPPPAVTKPNPSIEAPPPTTKSNPQPRQPPLAVTKPNPSIEPPPPSTKSNPQPPPAVTNPNPSIEAPPKTEVITPIASAPKPSAEHRQPLNPLSYCEVPIYASYAVKKGKYCWCTMESYDTGCFEKIWRATTTYDFVEIDKNCCDALWASHETCGTIFGRSRYFVSSLKQHCSMFY